jgi:hypothetical protein
MFVPAWSAERKGEENSLAKIAKTAKKNRKIHFFPNFRLSFFLGGLGDLGVRYSGSDSFPLLPGGLTTTTRNESRHVAATRSQLDNQ